MDSTMTLDELHGFAAKLATALGDDWCHTACSYADVFRVWEKYTDEPEAGWRVGFSGTKSDCNGWATLNRRDCHSGMVTRHAEASDPDAPYEDIEPGQWTKAVTIVGPDVEFLFEEAGPGVVRIQWFPPGLYPPERYGLLPQLMVGIDSPLEGAVAVIPDLMKACAERMRNWTEKNG